MPKLIFVLVNLALEVSLEQICISGLHSQFKWLKQTFLEPFRLQSEANRTGFFQEFLMNDFTNLNKYCVILSLLQLHQTDVEWSNTVQTENLILTSGRSHKFYRSMQIHAFLVAEMFSQHIQVSMQQASLLIKDWNQSITRT